MPVTTLDAQGVQKLWGDVQGSDDYKALPPHIQQATKNAFVKKFGDRFTGDAKPKKKASGGMGFTDAALGMAGGLLPGGAGPPPAKTAKAFKEEGGLGQVISGAAIGGATFLPTMAGGWTKTLMEGGGVDLSGMAVPKREMTGEQFAERVKENQELIGSKITPPMDTERAQQIAGVVFKPFEYVAQAAERVSKAAPFIKSNPVAQKMLEDALHIGVYVAGGAAFHTIKGKLHNRKITPKTALEDLASLKTKIKEKFPDEAATMLDEITRMEKTTSDASAAGVTPPQIAATKSSKKKASKEAQKLEEAMKKMEGREPPPEATGPVVPPPPEVPPTKPSSPSGARPMLPDQQYRTKIAEAEANVASGKWSPEVGKYMKDKVTKEYSTQMAEAEKKMGRSYEVPPLDEAGKAKVAEIKAAAEAGELETGPQGKGKTARKTAKKTTTPEDAVKTLQGEGAVDIGKVKTSDLFKEMGSILSEKADITGKITKKAVKTEYTPAEKAAQNARLGELGREAQKRFIAEGKKKLHSLKTFPEYLKSNGLDEATIKAVYAAMRAHPEKLEAPPTQQTTQKTTPSQPVGVSNQKVETKVETKVEKKITPPPRPRQQTQKPKTKPTRVAKTVSQQKIRDKKIAEAANRKKNAITEVLKERGRVTRPKGREFKSPELKKAIDAINKKYEAEVAAINKKYPDKTVHEYSPLKDTEKLKLDKRPPVMVWEPIPQPPRSMKIAPSEPYKSPAPQSVYKTPGVGLKERGFGKDIIKKVVDAKAQGKNVRWVDGVSPEAFKIISNTFDKHGKMKKGTNMDTLAGLVYRAQHKRAWLEANKAGKITAPGKTKRMTREQELVKIKEMIDSGEYTRLRKGESIKDKSEISMQDALARMMDVEIKQKGLTSLETGERAYNLLRDEGPVLYDKGEGRRFIQKSTSKAMDKMTGEGKIEADLKAGRLIDPEAQKKADAHLAQQKQIDMNSLAKAFPLLKKRVLRVLRKRHFDTEMELAHSMSLGEAIRKVIGNSEATIWLRDFFEAEFTKKAVGGKKKGTRSPEELRAYNEGLTMLKMMSKKSGREIASYLKDMGYSAKDIADILKDMKNPVLAGSSDPNIQAMLNADRYNIESDAALREMHKTDWKDMGKQFASQWVDVSSELKSALTHVSRQGEIAKKRLELIAGAHPEGVRRFKEAASDIYGGLTNNEVHALNSYIDMKRKVQIAKNKGEREFQTLGYKVKDFQEWVKAFEEGKTLSSINKKSRRDLILKKADLYEQSMQGVLKTLLDDRVISKKTYEKLISQGFYSPQKVMEYYIDGVPQDAFSRTAGIRESGLKRLTKEGTTKIVEKDSHLLLAEHMIGAETRAFKNRADLALLELARNNKDNGIVKQWPEGKKVPAGYEKVYAMEDGKPRGMIMKHDYAKQWVTSRPEITMPFATAMSWLSGTKILKFFATGANPEFAIMNLPRDIAHAWLTQTTYSKHTPVAGVQLVADMMTVAPDAFGFHPLKGAQAILTGKDYKAVMDQAFNFRGRRELLSKEGGMMGFLTQASRSGEFSPDSGVFSGMKIGRAMDAFQDYLGYLGTSSELWTRLALRERGIKNGMEPWEATHGARNYLDFSQGGGMAKGVDVVVPYFNPAIQGTRGVFRAAKENPGTFSYKVAQIGTLASGLYYANSILNKECWDSISDIEKVNNWIFTTPFQYYDSDNQLRHWYFRIAKDQGQRLFASAFENLAAMSRGEDFNYQKMYEGVAAALPIVPTSMLPPTADALFGTMLNADLWKSGTSGEYVPIWKGDKVVSNREYDDWTNPALKTIAGDTLGMSPKRTQYALDQYFVSNNNVFSTAVGYGFKQIFKDWSEKEQVKVSEDVLRNIPGIKRLLKTTDPYEKHRKTMEEAKTIGNTKWLDMKRGLDVLSKDYYDSPTKEGRQKVMDYIASYKSIDPMAIQSLTERFIRSRVLHKLPDRKFWHELAEVKDNRERAYRFHYKYLDTKPSERKALIKQMVQVPGIATLKFIAEWSVLRKKIDNVSTIREELGKRMNTIPKTNSNPRKIENYKPSGTIMPLITTGGDNGKESKETQKVTRPKEYKFGITPPAGR